MTSFEKSKKKSVRNVEGHKGKNFQKFFFLFLIQNVSIRKNKQKKFFDFFWVRDPHFGSPFDPYLENQGIFWHAVFSKWFITLRSFFYQRLNKIVRVVCSQKSKNINLGPILPLLGQKKGDPIIFLKIGLRHFFPFMLP